MNTSRVPVLALAAITLAGCGSATSTSSPTSATTSTPTMTSTVHPTLPVPRPCTSKSVSFTVGSGGAAAGNWYSLLIATNTSKAACTLHGAPAVLYIDEHGARVGAPATLEADQPYSTVTLKPGERAAATLHQASPYNYDAAQCHVTPTAGYAVTLPGDRMVRVPAVATACASSAVHGFSVIPFTKDFHEVNATP